MKYVLIIVLTFMLTYLTCAFISNTFNTMEWSTEGRFFYVLFSLVIAIAICVIRAEYEDDML